MILIVTNREDYTADYLILGLKDRGTPFARFNTEDFPVSVDLELEFSQFGVNGTLKLPDQTLSLHEIKSVWFRRPVPSVTAKEIEDQAAKQFIIVESRETLAGLWHLLPCFWISHPKNLRAAESKLHQLTVAVKVGFTIPSTIVTDSPSMAERFYRKHSGAVVYKPLRQSRIVRNEDLSLIFTSPIQETLPTNFANVCYAPTLLQAHIEKKLEVRATVVGNKVFTVEIHSQEIIEAKHDWRRVDARKLKHLPHELPEAVEESCRSLVRELGLAFGAIDLILTPKDEYVFLEVNANGQWAWIQQICPEIQIREALIDLLIQGPLITS